MKTDGRIPRDVILAFFSNRHKRIAKHTHDYRVTQPWVPRTHARVLPPPRHEETNWRLGPVKIRFKRNVPAAVPIPNSPKTCAFSNREGV